MNSIIARLDRIEKKLDFIVDQLSTATDDTVADTLDVDITLEEQTTEGATAMQMNDSQQVVVTLRPKTKKGKPAQVQPGSVLWTGPSFVAITPAADGLTATFVAMGVGSGEYSVSADADLGEGVITISKTSPCIVTPSQADSLDVEEGAPEEQVAPGPAPNPARSK